MHFNCGSNVFCISNKNTLETLKKNHCERISNAFQIDFKPKKPPSSAFVVSYRFKRITNAFEQKHPKHLKREVL